MMPVQFILTFALAGLSISMAATVECPVLQFWNSTSCTPCTNCLPGSGVKTKCSAEQDTECQPCWLGYDYSNTTGQEPCLLCDQGSNCLNGNPKVVENCTTISPTVCDGCADENFFDHFAGPDGGCVKCSPPCGIFEVETTKCTTAHDRECKQQWTVITTPVTSITPVYGTEHPYTEYTKRNQPEETSPGKKTWLWAIISVFVVIIAVPVIAGISRRKRKTRKDDDPRLPARDVEQARPLMRPCGLDMSVRELSIDYKKYIGKRLNVPDGSGFEYWRFVAERVGLKDESADWGRADNPTEKLLTAFGEKKEGTIRNLVNGIKEAGLEQFAEEMEKKFGKTGEDESEDQAAATWV